MPQHTLPPSPKYLNTILADYVASGQAALEPQGTSGPPAGLIKTEFLIQWSEVAGGVESAF